MIKRTRDLIKYMKKRFNDNRIIYIADIFKNLVFIFGVLKPEHPLYNNGERGFITCYRRRTRNNKEYLEWSSSWIIDKEEVKCFIEGLTWMNKQINEIPKKMRRK